MLERVPSLISIAQGNVSGVVQAAVIAHYLNNFVLMLSAALIYRIANQLTGHILYRWTTMSADGENVRCSNGIEIGIDRTAETFLIAPIDDRTNIQQVFVR